VNLGTFIVAAFCLVDDSHQHTRAEALISPGSVAPGRLVRSLPRGCYGLNPITATARWRKRHAKATKCSPATVSGSRS
jgi:hypothetical protein